MRIFTIISGIFAAVFGVTVIAQAVQTTVPSAPGSNYVLLSTSTGAYIAVATSSLGITGGSSSGGSVATSSQEVATQVAVFSSNSATPALIEGDAGLTYTGGAIPQLRIGTSSFLLFRSNTAQGDGLSDFYAQNNAGTADIEFSVGTGNGTFLDIINSAGEIYLTPDSPSWIRTLGTFALRTGAGLKDAVFDASALTGSDKTFTFNNWSGTINAATSSFMTGFFVATSTTASQLPFASTTALSATTLCLTGDTCRTSWPSAGAWPFTTTDTNFGVAVQSTTTPEWFRNGVFASSTSQFLGTNIWGTLTLKATSSALLATDSTGNVIATTSVGTNFLTGLLATINGTAVTAGGSPTVTAASSTLLANNNTWTGLNQFSKATSTLFTTTGSTWLANTSGNVAIGATSTPGSLFSINSVANILSAGTSTWYQPFQFWGNMSSGIASSTTQNATITVDWNGSNSTHGGNEFRVILTQSTSIVLNSTSSNPIDGAHYILKVCQDGVGSRTNTFATPGQLVWANGTTTVSAAANTGTMIGMVYDGTTQRYDILASSTISDTRTCRP